MTVAIAQEIRQTIIDFVDNRMAPKTAPASAPTQEKKVVQMPEAWSKVTKYKRIERKTPFYYMF